MLENVVIKKYAKSPFPTKYRPEMDVIPVLDEEGAAWYLSHIGILRWIVELGCIDIATEVSLLASEMCNPREGHKVALLNVYAWLRKHPIMKLPMDPTYVEWKKGDYTPQDWTDFYGDIEEDIPGNAPEALGKPVQIIEFFDADHAGDKSTRLSRTSVLIFLNKAPVIWHTQAQNGVEGSTFGSEFIATKCGIEIVEALRYKRRMMGIPLCGPADCRLDNDSVYKNTSLPESQLKKKCHSIAYHLVREAVAAGIARMAWEDSKSNLAGCLTKPQGGKPRIDLCRHFIHQ